MRTLKCTQKFHLLTTLLCLMVSCRGEGGESMPVAADSTNTEASRILFTNPIQYAYDAAGRLIAVYDPNGNSGQYVYDAAGNILSVTQFASGTLAIFDFSPRSGAIASSVTITGSGFSTTLANNTVKFNGTAATVTAASAQQLAVTVPSGATSGTVTVTVAGVTKTSTATFAVGTAGPQISSFTPTVGNANTTVTVTGTGFEMLPANNAVTIGSRFAVVTAATATQLTLVVPPEGVSGKVAVSTPKGSATSTQDFYLLPAGVSPANVVVEGRVAADGSSLGISLTASTQTGLVIFDANRADFLSLGYTNISINTGFALIELADINGKLLNASGSMSSGADYAMDFPQIPATGTYQLIVTPENGASAISATFWLSNMIQGVTIPGVFASNRPGQRGLGTFTPTENPNFTCANNSFSDISYTLTGTDNTSTYFAFPNNPNLVSTGIRTLSVGVPYSIYVNAMANTGSATIGLALP